MIITECVAKNKTKRAPDNGVPGLDAWLAGEDPVALTNIVVGV